MVAEPLQLCGMKAICKYLNKSEPTVRRLIESERLPAAKIAGEWVSDVELIAAWRKTCIQNAGKHRRREVKR